MASSIYAVVVLAVAGVVGIVGLAAVSPNENDALLMVIVGFLAPTIASILNKQTTQEVKESTSQANAKLDRLDSRLNGELDARLEDTVVRALESRMPLIVESVTARLREASSGTDVDSGRTG